MKFGIRAHDLGNSSSVQELIQKVKQYQLDGIQLVIHKALDGENGILNKEKAKLIAKPLIGNNIKVMMLGAYFNPVHFDSEKQRSGIEKFKNTLFHGSYFDCPYVGTETGSYNGDQWTYHPNNHSEQAYQQVKQVFQELVDYRKANNLTTRIAIEGAYNHVIYQPSVLKRLIDDLDDLDVRVIVDIFNYINIDNHQNHVEILEECLKLFKDRIAIIHLKDYLILDQSIEQVPIGKGLMNYQKIIPLLKQNVPNAYLIFEGTEPKDINDSLAHLLQYI